MSEHQHTKWADLRLKRGRHPEGRPDYQQADRRIRFGEQVRAARERAGLTQAELARRIGSTQPAIARLELGGSDPKLDTFERIGRALGLDLVVEFRHPVVAR